MLLMQHFTLYVPCYTVLNSIYLAELNCRAKNQFVLQFSRRWSYLQCHSFILLIVLT